MTYFLRLINGILDSVSVSCQLYDKFIAFLFGFDEYVIVLVAYVSCTSTVWDFFSHFFPL